jgi:hypothetical protein
MKDPGGNKAVSGGVEAQFFHQAGSLPENHRPGPWLSERHRFRMTMLKWQA